MGLAEKSVLLVYHPDAEDWINVNNDLEKLLLELRDPTKRFARQVSPAAACSLRVAQPVHASLPCSCTCCAPLILLQVPPHAHFHMHIKLCRRHISGVDLLQPACASKLGVGSRN